jgi:hypothetical protein
MAVQRFMDPAYGSNERFDDSKSKYSCSATMIFGSGFHPFILISMNPKNLKK